MTHVHPGRFTARIEGEEIVVFLIGMRFNNPLNVRRSWPVFAAMPRMLAELSRQRELGLLGYHVWPGRTVLVLQYWQSFAQLDAYARDAEHLHLPAWREFNRAVGASGQVGIWHETYVVPADQAEAVYGNMPVFGLAAATTHHPAAGGLRSARTRMGLSDDQPPEVPRY